MTDGFTVLVDFPGEGARRVPAVFRPRPDTMALMVQTLEIGPDDMEGWTFQKTENGWQAVKAESQLARLPAAA